MMYSKVAMMALIGSAEALNAAPVLRGSALATPRMAPLRMDEAAAPAKKETEAKPAPPPAPPPAPEYSQALPFLTRRASLGPKGALVGDVGFDPLGFTEVLPLVRTLADHIRTQPYPPAYTARAHRARGSQRRRSEQQQRRRRQQQRRRQQAAAAAAATAAAAAMAAAAMRAQKRAALTYQRRRQHQHQVSRTAGRQVGRSAGRSNHSDTVTNKGRRRARRSRDGIADVGVADA
jgi:hypothetical protein